MNEIEINGISYKIGKLSAVAQFHVLRRIAPMLASVGLTLTQLKEARGDDTFMRLLQPASEILAKMTDTDAEYVLSMCLGACARRSGEGWAQVWVKGGGLAFADMDMTSMLQLVIAAIKENMSGFFAAIPAVV